MRLLQDADVKNKAVFLRTDFNVPINNGVIGDNYRIKAVVPTLKYLLEKRAKIIIGSHLGRPEGRKTAESSLAPVAAELSKIIGEPVVMAPEPVGNEASKMVEVLEPGQILLLENLRWNPGEEKDDPNIAKQLAMLAEIYINDAFAVSHRANASVHAIASILPSYAGLLMQAEVTNLTLLVNSPKPPLLLIIGGVKVADKAGVIDKIAPVADAILVGGGVGNTFLKANGVNVGESAIEEEMVEKCKQMLLDYGEKILLPVDGVKEDTISGSFKIMDLGPRTTDKFVSEIMKAKTVFWNGSLGKSEDPRYQNGMLKVAKAMGELHETTLIAGGDTVGFVMEQHLEDGISFLSTGGGAALEFLAGVKLPGLEVLN